MSNSFYVIKESVGYVTTNQNSLIPYNCDSLDGINLCKFPTVEMAENYKYKYGKETGAKIIRVCVKTVYEESRCA
jgi:hypothetical protein